MRTNQAESSDAAEHKEDSTSESGQGTFASAVVNLSISCVGTGVLAFPYTFKSCGLSAALITCGGMAVVLGFTLYACVYCCERASRLGEQVTSYHKLVHVVGGERLATITEVVIWLYSFGISLGCLVIIGDIAEPLLHRAFPNMLGTSLEMRALAISIITLVAVLPLSILRSITSLSYSSFVGVVGVLYLVGLITCKYFTHSEPEPADKPHMGMASFSGIFTSIPIICYALGCHIQGPIIYYELKPELRNMATWQNVLLCTWALCLSMYIPAGLLGYLTFGGGTPQDILDAGDDSGYAIDDWTADVARGFMIINSICGFPLNHMPARAALFSFYTRIQKQRRDKTQAMDPILEELHLDQDQKEAEMGWGFLLISTMGYVLSAMFLAIVCDQLAVVFDIFGAICGSFEVLIAPALFWIVLGSSRSRHIVGGCIIVLGTMVMVGGLWSTIETEL